MTEKTIQLSEYISYQFQNIWAWFWVRIGVSSMIAFPTMIFGVDTLWILVLFAMLVLDFISGIIKAKIKEEQITSRKMFNSVVKAILYVLFIAGSYLMTLLFKEYVPLHSLAVTFLVLVEFVSFIENVLDAGVKLPFGIQEWVRVMLNKHKK